MGVSVAKIIMKEVLQIEQLVLTTSKREGLLPVIILQSMLIAQNFTTIINLQHRLFFGIGYSHSVSWCDLEALQGMACI